MSRKQFQLKIKLYLNAFSLWKTTTWLGSHSSYGTLHKQHRNSPTEISRFTNIMVQALYVSSNWMEYRKPSLVHKRKSMQQKLQSYEKGLFTRSSSLRTRRIEQSPLFTHNDTALKMQLSAEQVSKNHSGLFLCFRLWAILNNVLFPGVTTVYGPAEILKILPHRYT